MRRSGSAVLAAVVIGWTLHAQAQDAAPGTTSATPAESAGPKPDEAGVADRPGRKATPRQAGRRVVAPMPPERPSEVGKASVIGAGDQPSRSLFGTVAVPEVTRDQSPPNPLLSLFGLPSIQAPGERLPSAATRSQIDTLIAHHARLNGVPEALVHRIVIRESRYNPRAVGRGGAMGLMQIKTATARGVGYQGGPAGLLDAETNLTYGVKYLAGAWRVSGGSHDRAVSHYAGGYYYAAKRMHGGRGRTRDVEPVVAQAPAAPASLFSLFTPTGAPN